MEAGERRSRSLPYIEDMRGNVMEMLRVYLGLEGEEAERFLTLSTNRKAALLEEVLLDA